MAASDWSGSGTQSNPYVIPPDDLPWWEDIYPLIRGTGTGDSSTSSTYFQLDLGVAGNPLIRLTNVTPNTQDSEGDWGIVSGLFSASETTNGGTTNGDVTEDAQVFFTVPSSSSRILFRVYPTRNRDRTDKLYLSFYAPFGTAGRRNVLLMDRDPIAATNRLYNYRSSSGFRDASGSTRILPTRWFQSSTSTSDHKLARVRISTSSPRLQIRFGDIDASTGPDLKEYYRVNTKVEIKEVGRGDIKPNVSNTYVIPVLGGSSDTTDPYHWNPTDTQAVADFLSALNKDTIDLEIAFNDPTTTSAHHASETGDGFIRIAWQRLSTANNFEYRSTTTSESALSSASWFASASTASGNSATFRGLTNGTQYWYQVRLTETDGTVYTSEVVTETPTAARTAVTSQLRGVVAFGYEVDSELNVNNPAVTSQLRGVSTFGYDLDADLTVTSRAVTTSQLRGVVSFGYEVDSDLTVSSRTLVTSQLRGVVPFGYEVDSDLTVSSRTLVTSQLTWRCSIRL